MQFACFTERSSPMACRIGMSTNPQNRIDYWKNREGHTRSRILARGLTYDGALAREKKEAADRGCTVVGGGQPVSGRKYSVYMVWGGTIH